MGERYTSAINSSNLRVTDRPTDSDTLIAAGLGDRRLGTLMRRLTAEWDAAAKPGHPNKFAVERLAKTLPAEYKDNDGNTHTDDGKGLVRANKLAQQWYHDAQLEVMARLRTLPLCKKMLAYTAKQKGIADPWKKSGAVIFHYLSQRCPVCLGRQWKVAPGSVYLSNKICSACKGLGDAATPFGEDGHRLKEHLDFVVGKASKEMDDLVKGKRHKSNVISNKNQITCP